MKKGAWTKQQDQKLFHGRLHRRLRPHLSIGNFSEDEEDLIVKLHALLGDRWSLIAGRLPGRTENDVKHLWESRLKTKLRKKGIDPNNHRPYHFIFNNNGQAPGNSTTISTASSASSSSSHPKSSNIARKGQCLPDLNLDLTLASKLTPSSPPNIPSSRSEGGRVSDSSTSSIATAPQTLLLFR